MNPKILAFTKYVLGLRVLLFLLFCSVAAYAQMPFDAQKLSPAKLRRINRRDSLMDKKRFGRAVIELGVDELFPWSLDRYIRKADYAKISFSTVWSHLNPGSWEFDNDEFQTNQFGHPYHGSYYFNAFRTNGHTFWESVPAAFVGSYIWETAAENQNPAPNDFINTSFGGVVLGEMTYRLANKIINNRSRGFKRQASEVVALLVNPTNGLNRILDGKWGRVMRNSNERDSSKVAMAIDGGFRRFGANNINGRFGWYGHLNVLYGTPYEDYKKAFSNININVEVGKDDSSKVNIVSVYGSLTGWELQSDSSMRHLVILSANYDYIHNEAFFYSGQSVKMNLFSQFMLSHKIKLNTIVGAGPVILAAVPDMYLYKGRNYDYGSGLGFNGSLKLTFDQRFAYAINYRGGWLKTINGNASHYFLHTVSNEVSYGFIKNTALVAEWGYFILKGHYDKHPEVNNTYPYLRASVRYSLDLK
ncbi:uncharacterized protein DUF3943 [Mucilaginibacter gracilis]|uniref:Uncharacterized protein DUF3943 n=1 Tax=Mucilaginibacter gracilis TaxID=423350 RepID=A0A495J8J0_9SPHI|nr:DUF3943 domain-containing protein [Mucilaginibacter gracilis]RKR85305.1 uncharacterized protein DUF3943 [Mucilaginibacter gracilis]